MTVSSIVQSLPLTIREGRPPPAGKGGRKDLKGLFIGYIHRIIIVEISLLLIMRAGYAAGRTVPFATKL